MLSFSDTYKKYRHFPMMTVALWQQLQDIADRVPLFGQHHLFCSQHISIQLTDIRMTDHESVNPIKCCVRLTSLED